MDPMLTAFSVSLFSIAVAEFGDKTQLALIMLAASLRRPKAILMGMIAGYVVVAGAGVLVGQVLLVIVPLSTLTFASGVVFVIVGLLILKANIESDIGAGNSRSPFQAAALVIVLTELGDKTQLVTIALAARFNQPIAVFVGALMAFVVVDGLSVVLAGRIGQRLPASKIKKVSAVMFIVLGILTIFGLL